MLTTIDRVKRYLTIDPAADPVIDQLLNELIAGASAAIESYCGRVFLLQQWTERYNGGKRLIVLNKAPVASIISVKSNGVIMTGYSLDGNVIYRDTDCAVFGNGFKTIEVVYTAGFTTVPEDIQLLATKVVAAKYGERDRVGFRSKSLAGETVSFFDIDTSPSYTSILDTYKRRVFSA